MDNPLIAAALACVFTLGGTFGLASVLRQRAARVSHELPVATRTLAQLDIPQAQQIAHGRKLFLNSCAHCHGDDARGDEGPDLHDLQVSDRRIATVVTRGIKGEMPSFAKKHNATDIAVLVTYLHSLDVAP